MMARDTAVTADIVSMEFTGPAWSPLVQQYHYVIYGIFFLCRNLRGTYDILDNIATLSLRQHFWKAADLHSL